MLWLSKICILVLVLQDTFGIKLDQEGLSGNVSPLKKPTDAGKAKKPAADSEHMILTDDYRKYEPKSYHDYIGISETPKSEIELKEVSEAEFYRNLSRQPRVNSEKWRQRDLKKDKSGEKEDQDRKVSQNVSLPYHKQVKSSIKKLRKMTMKNIVSTLNMLTRDVSKLRRVETRVRQLQDMVEQQSTRINKLEDEVRDLKRRKTTRNKDYIGIVPLHKEPTIDVKSSAKKRSKRSRTSEYNDWMVEAQTAVQQSENDQTMAERVSQIKEEITDTISTYTETFIDGIFGTGTDEVQPGVNPGGLGILTDMKHKVDNLTADVQVLKVYQGGDLIDINGVLKDQLGAYLRQEMFDIMSGQGVVQQEEPRVAQSRQRSGRKPAPTTPKPANSVLQSFMEGMQGLTGEVSTLTERLDQHVYAMDVCRQLIVSGIKQQNQKFRGGLYYLHGGWCLTSDGKSRAIYKHKTNESYISFSGIQKAWMIGDVPCSSKGGLKGRNEVVNPERESAWNEYNDVKGSWLLNNSATVRCFHLY